MGRGAWIRAFPPAVPFPVAPCLATMASAVIPAIDETYVNAPPPPSMASFSAFSRNSRPPGAKRARGEHPLRDTISRYFDDAEGFPTHRLACVSRLLYIRR